MKYPFYYVPLIAAIFLHLADAKAVVIEPVQACVIARTIELTPLIRDKVAQCLEWDPQAQNLCGGAYQPIVVSALNSNEIQVMADEALLRSNARSKLAGNVQVRESERMVQADTAYIYRTGKKVTKIELLGEVRYLENGRFMIAHKAVLNPQDKSGQISDALYRFDVNKSQAALPAWGRAALIERFANQNLLLQKATYTTCAPKDNAWQLEAREIFLDHAKNEGTAKHAILRVRDWPVLYTPYLNFPTSNERKSGFLMPVYGYSNIGGADIGLPYYWNMAPNYDATLLPRVYTRRGFMVGGDFRYLTPSSLGIVSSHVLPNDKAFSKFLRENEQQYPSLRDLSTNRWSLLMHDATQVTANLSLGINYQQVSDDYYLQDFSTNLVTLTQNQLLRQGDFTYTTNNWLVRGMLQSYQTLHPINQSIISDVYERPQLYALGNYFELPMNAQLQITGQFDYFHWPTNVDYVNHPQGPRYRLNPILTLPNISSWGYFTPAIQLNENYYDLNRYDYKHGVFNRTIPGYSVDSGLFFERDLRIAGQSYIQTLEPRLYYVYVPYHDQSSIPVFDSGYMIFTYDQLFRTNRFSGFDRIGDANQLAYALTTRWLSEETGEEKISFSIGQLGYFANRRVQLCYRQFGSCVDDPTVLGYLSPVAKSSPVASRFTYHFNPSWGLNSDYVWSPATRATNNAVLNLRYQPPIYPNKIFQLGYSYLVNGDKTTVIRAGTQNDALNQATVAYAWPFTEKLSTLGAYSYNISKQYNMMTFLGLQYEDCCWAMRLIGGRTFRSLTPDSFIPQYTNNVYLQILLKGLGSVASSDPTGVIQSYLPGYSDIFRK